MNKELLNIENWGIRLEYSKGEVQPYFVIIEDCGTSGCGTSFANLYRYETMGEAIDKIVDAVLDIRNVYAPEDLSDDYKKAFDRVGDDRISDRETTSVFLQAVLEGIAYANER